MEMAISWICRLLLLFSVAVSLADSVQGVQRTYARVPTGAPCFCPYTCLSTSECAGRHAVRGTQEVLFQCGDRGKICCPPVRYATTSPSVGREDDCFGYQGDEGHFSDRTHRPPVTEKPVEKEYFHVPSGVYVHESLENQQKKQKFQPGTPQKVALQIPTEFLPSETNCGVNNFANRITEGEEVTLGEYPWMVLTGVKDRYGNYRWNCGGTLINGWYVLTAAHCLIVENRTIEYVRLGEHSLTNATDCYRGVCLDSPEDVPIAEVIPHEKWNTTTIKNDIALVRLSRNPLLLGKSNIYPICLPFDVEKLNITPTSKFQVAGWGKTDWNEDEGSDVLRKASISGVTRDECNICKDKKKQQYCPIADTQLCVQGWKAVDVCKGDSGGPLMVLRLNIFQVGITSFKGSEYCGAENIPSIFTRVDSYMSWILDHVRQ